MNCDVQYIYCMNISSKMTACIPAEGITPPTLKQGVLCYINTLVT